MITYSWEMMTLLIWIWNRFKSPDTAFGECTERTQCPTDPLPYYDASLMTVEPADGVTSDPYRVDDGDAVKYIELV